MAFAQQEGLIFLGESSCKEATNVHNLLNKLVVQVHETQTDLVRRGIKTIDDLKFGEEERNIKYDRCC